MMVPDGHFGRIVANSEATTTVVILNAVKDPQLLFFRHCPLNAVQDAARHEGTDTREEDCSHRVSQRSLGRFEPRLVGLRARGLPQSAGSKGRLKSNCGSFRCASG
jgi:hypothetical protein